MRNEISEHNDACTAKGQDNRKLILILLLLLLMLAGFIFGTKVFEYLNNRKTGGITVSQAGYFVEKAAELISGDKLDAGNNFTIAGYGKITMKANESKATVNLINPEENEDLFYLQFEIMLKDSGELLYKSDLLEPGMEIKEADFNQSFEKGVYEAIVKVTPVMMDNPEATCNIMAYGTKLHVE